MARHAHGGHRARFRARTPEQLMRRTTLQSSVISGVAALLAAAIARYPTAAQAPAPTASTKLSSTSGASVPDIFRDLASSNSEVTLSALASLGLVLDKEQDPAIRRRVLLRVALFVRSHAPLPEGGTYRYCTQESAPPPSLEASAAMELIGLRRSEDLSVPLDLSGSNLAYLKLPHLRLNNIRFDGALLCRTVLAGATLDGSTFDGATLRYSIITGAVGLNAAGLATSTSLCGAELPLPLRTDPTLRRLEASDPEPHLRCDVHD